MGDENDGYMIIPVYDGEDFIIVRTTTKTDDEIYEEIHGQIDTSTPLIV